MVNDLGVREGQEEALKKLCSALFMEKAEVVNGWKGITILVLDRNTNTTLYSGGVESEVEQRPEESDEGEVPELGGDKQAPGPQVSEDGDDSEGEGDGEIAPASGDVEEEPESNKVMTDGNQD